MMTVFSPAGSIRRRLVVILLVVAAVLAGLLFVSVRTVANTAVETTQDAILGAATVAIAEELRGGEDGLTIDIPYAAFSMLGATGQDRVFYRILVGAETVTGYADLPLPDAPLSGLKPTFFSQQYDGDVVRTGAVSRSVLVDGRSQIVTVLVAQTRTAQDAISRQMANQAATLGLGFFAFAAILSIFTARSVLTPLNRLAEAMGRRGPQDLRPVDRAVPTELAPLMQALNGFIARLRGALTRTETFITEAAHHVRTPLATVRVQAEIAMRQTDDDALRATLRNIIRAVDDSARSAGQLLDHATVVYRADQRADELVALGPLVLDVVDSFSPTADMRDIALRVDAPDEVIALQFDRLLIESALRNLIDNAVKYSYADSIVDVQLSTDGTFAKLQVLDRGRGIGDGNSVQLVARFKRGENVGDVVGSGLGLTIVRDVTRAIGGSFDIKERQGGGTCAILLLPLA
ncbi:two-component system sensor histidine kinase TctE [Loktanella ponticola]|uniref:histidine kinase n=1 Tax=Yoonia ponticola TaxID=1524255 RepID=A0A7W9BLM0_9RHOB|nr:sensor histidine kinase [Yoonia ponticola]MBB5722751.1 two-component system sensor histidine kinase TctE [Yoonia ponticola]